MISTGVSRDGGITRTRGGIDHRFREECRGDAAMAVGEAPSWQRCVPKRAAGEFADDLRSKFGIDGAVGERHAPAHVVLGDHFSSVAGTLMSTTRHVSRPIHGSVQARYRVLLAVFAVIVMVIGLTVPSAGAAIATQNDVAAINVNVATAVKGRGPVSPVVVGISDALFDYGTVVSLDTTSGLAELTAIAGVGYDAVGLYSATVDLARAPNTPWAVVQTAAATDALASDVHGSTIDSTATTIAASATYTPWGEAASITAQPRLGYRGELTIAGLTHLRARDYDSTTGTFTTTDPRDGVNGTTVRNHPYHYTNNDPLNLIDPSGEQPFDGDFACIGEKLTEVSATGIVPDDVHRFFDGVNECEGRPRFLTRPRDIINQTASLVIGPGAELWGIASCLAGDDCTDALITIAAGLTAAPKTVRASIPDIPNNLTRQTTTRGTRVAAPGQWKVGDDVYSPTRSGDPSWSTVRTRHWKNQAASPDAADIYGQENIARMQRGLAPQRYNAAKGGNESMELSHEPVPFREGGRSFVERWPCEHALVDPFRKPGYC